MAIKVAAWNVEGRLTDYAEGKRGHPQQILEAIKQLDADLVVLPEAYLGEPAAGVDDYLRSLGYSWHDTPYGDQDRDWSKEFNVEMPSLRVLTRLGVTAVEIVCFGGVRNLLALTVIEPETEQELLVVATHLDDRTEQSRNLQVEEIINYITKKQMPTVMLGDFNAMWPTGRAKFLRSRAVRFVAHHISNAQFRSFATRVSEMAEGTVLPKLVERTGMRDADLRHHPTTTPKMRDALFMPSIRLLQIDHILHTPTVEVSDFLIGIDHGSDHRSIKATISLNSK